MNRTDPAAPETTPPGDRYEAADWLARRHDRVRYLADRLGALEARQPVQEGVGMNPDVIAQAVYDAEIHNAEWAVYVRHHRPPGGDDDARYEAWLDAGPAGTPGAQAFGPMSSGEKNLVRLLATLGRPRQQDDEYEYDAPTRRAGWMVSDVSSLDEHGAAVVADWLAIVRAQLPDWLYPGGGRPPSIVERMRTLEPPPVDG